MVARAIGSFWKSDFVNAIAVMNNIMRAISLKTCPFCAMTDALLQQARWPGGTVRITSGLRLTVLRAPPGALPYHLPTIPMTLPYTCWPSSDQNYIELKPKWHMTQLEEEMQV